MFANEKTLLHVGPVKGDAPNNFQNIMKLNGALLVMWGDEEFIVDAWIDRTTGKILRATMDNTLTLRMRVGCNESLDTCAAELPRVIHRDETLHIR
jgi:hypothetical protein